MNKELKNKFENALFKVLSVPSVQGKATADAPFGEEVKKALTLTLSIAEELGFKTKNYDNYVGEVIWGTGKPFGVLCHLDVVPAGNLAAWNTDPFTPTVKDGKLFCRGALDDKSAAISTLFAMYALKEDGYEPKRQIRLILGCNEESGWGCIKHYNEVAVMPEEGISPDADFPVIYAEKGILHVKYAFKKLKQFTACGGTAANVVCDYACVTAADLDKELAEKHGLKVCLDGGNCGNSGCVGGEIKAESFGKAAHGSTPEKGLNALKALTAFLEDGGYIEKGVYDGMFGARAGVENFEDETGKLTFSPDVLSTDDTHVYYVTDIRYPSTVSRETIEKSLAKIGDFEVLSYQAPLFNDKNGKLVTTLCKVWEKYSGKKEEPIAIGGGTYARALKCGVAFGPAIGKEADSIHQPNEFVTLSTLDIMFDVYKDALYELCIK
ncbi:MAG TPA: hypothetical protein DDY77_01620 [Clostridiales bacterium]|nr:hypothetical protein [Clostridiales bacterium]